MEDVAVDNSSVIWYLNIPTYFTFVKPGTSSNDVVMFMTSSCCPANVLNIVMN